ncbi:unnamed protein product [Chrysodeixis includens]|uniref:Biogenesis of lysosome-related organelles complex 1 subunit 2 n=1 Tax=Chrysodeixis includens TaxID=689277 RepID=A0A9N8PYZ7_CHRIL|nr:unnamed protein product [Chrysodeixis includens]
MQLQFACAISIDRCSRTRRAPPAAPGSVGVDLYVSPSPSSFEVLDPHDPTLSRHATHLFKKTNEYLQGEIASGGDHYLLLEDINRLAITKYTDLRNLAVNLNRTLVDYNEAYITTIRPLLAQVDDIDEMVAKLEENAHRLDGYTKQLKTRVRELYGTK